MRGGGGVFAVVVCGADGVYLESNPMSWDNAEIVFNVLVNSGMVVADEVVVAALIP